MNITKTNVEALAQTLFSHGALNNDFYERWLNETLTFDQVEVFARNYWARTRRTATMVALSLLRAKTLHARVEIVKNLYSELGGGDVHKAHSVLLQGYLLDLLSRLAKRPYSLQELESGPLLSSTRLFIDEHDALYAPQGLGRSEPHVLGALLAQEWLAYSMLTRLYEGARNYQYVYKHNDEFHEQCEYFHIHIGEAEKEHKVQAVEAAAIECCTEEDFSGLCQGFNRFLSITERYWQGIAVAMGDIPAAAVRA